MEMTPGREHSPGGGGPLFSRGRWGGDQLVDYIGFLGLCLLNAWANRKKDDVVIVNGWKWNDEGNKERELGGEKAECLVVCFCCIFTRAMEKTLEINLFTSWCGRWRRIRSRLSGPFVCDVIFDINVSKSWNEGHSLNAIAWEYDY